MPKVKLTPAQELIYNQLLNGKKLIRVNCHRMNGGETYWIDGNNLNTISYAGSVYKAANGLWNKLKKHGFEYENLYNKRQDLKMDSCGYVTIKN